MKALKRLLIFILCVAILTISCVPINALDEKIVFSLKNQPITASRTVRVVLSLVSNTGISGGSLNLAYNSDILSLAAYTYGSAMTGDIRSVTDDKKGNIRLTFVKTTGFIRGTGDVLILDFNIKTTAAFACDIKLINREKSLTGLKYTDVPYTCNTLNITEEGIGIEFKSNSGLTLDAKNKYIYGFKKETSNTKIGNYILGDYTCKFSGNYISTGDTLTAKNGDVYTLILMGDVNCDGRVTALDYLIVRRYIIGLYDFNPVQCFAADRDFNGEVSALDYLLLKIYLIS